MKSSDLINQTFGRLAVIGREKSNRKGNSMWLCRCECGNEKIFVGYSLSGGHTKSCGCINKDRLKTHGRSGRSGRTNEYMAWINIKSRCLNENNPEFFRYGGRGITVSDRWMQSFENFLEDMGEKPTLNHSIERNDVNGNYERSNCRWATNIEQSRNQRAHESNKTGVRGVTRTKNHGKYVVQIGVNYTTIYLGITESLEEAKRMRLEAEIKYWKKSS